MRRILDGMTLEILVERQREIDRKRATGDADPTILQEPVTGPSVVR
jgi:hypothetical protein